MAVKSKRDLFAIAIAPNEMEREKVAHAHAMIRQHLETD